MECGYSRSRLGPSHSAARSKAKHSNYFMDEAAQSQRGHGIPGKTGTLQSFNERTRRRESIKNGPQVVTIQTGPRWATRCSWSCSLLAPLIQNMAGKWHGNGWMDKIDWYWRFISVVPWCFTFWRKIARWSQCAFTVHLCIPLVILMPLIHIVSLDWGLPMIHVENIDWFDQSIYPPQIIIHPHLH